MRRFLDGLYVGAGALAAVCLAAICVLMLAQVAGRELGMLVRGADDITAWLCAAAAFLPLAHTFKSGELVRVGLLVEKVGERKRRVLEVFSLAAAAVVVGYMTWAVAGFVYESWKFKEVAQGLLPIPIWIPQLSFLAGVAVLFVAIVDELLAVLRGQKPRYRIAEEERFARGDFSEGV
ncbi:MAG: TRAP transporter small permease [Burkholderiales bacterium]|nr:TRAP transporter small permease [Burkholderiales bacterium]